MRKNGFVVMGHLLKLVTHCRISWRLLSPWERSVSWLPSLLWCLVRWG